MTAEQQLERSVLEGKERDELSAIAQAMSLKTNSRTKKADIIDQILDATGVTSGSASAASNGDGEVATPTVRSHLAAPARFRPRRAPARTRPPTLRPRARPARGRRRRHADHGSRRLRGGAPEGSSAGTAPGAGTDDGEARAPTRARRSSSSRPTWRRAPSPVAAPERPGQGGQGGGGQGGGNRNRQNQNRQNGRRPGRRRRRRQPAQSPASWSRARRPGRRAAGWRRPGPALHRRAGRGEGHVGPARRGLRLPALRGVPALVQGRVRLHQPGPALRAAPWRLRRGRVPPGERTTRSTRRCCASTRCRASTPRRRRTGPSSRTSRRCSPTRG